MAVLCRKRGTGGPGLAAVAGTTAAPLQRQWQRAVPLGHSADTGLAAGHDRGVSDGGRAGGDRHACVCSAASARRRACTICGRRADASGKLPADAQAQVLDHFMQQARTFEQNDRPAEACEAYAQALNIAPDISAAIVGWVAANMATHGDFAIDAASRARLQQVIAREPDNQRGLWLLGISDFQQQDFAAATAHWRHLHGLLETGSPMQKAVADKIAVAESMARARQSARGTR